MDKQYKNLLKDILDNGGEKSDRTGTGTFSVFGRLIRHDMEDGFPLLTTKKMSIKSIMTELKWFLKGYTNIKYLIDNGCNIWNGDAYKKYCKSVPNQHPNFLTTKEFVNTIKTNSEFAKEWGELGPIYGKQWRDWGGVDQIANLIKELRKNRDSRRHIVSAWNVGELDKMTLPPCHYALQCYVSNNGKLSLMWNQRSVDTFLGLPYNIGSYAMLLLLLCEETGYEPGELIASLGDVHLYSNHIEQAKLQLTRFSCQLPTVKLSNVDILNGEFDYELINYKSHPKIKAPLSN
jgi:thymidylate synthase